MALCAKGMHTTEMEDENYKQQQQQQKKSNAHVEIQK